MTRRIGRGKIIACLALASLASACAASGSQGCAPGTGRPLRVFTLYFGFAVDGRDDVSAGEWRLFQDGTITTNLPGGYTVLDASGAWMNPRTRQATREASKVLIAALPDDAASLAAVNRIRAAYQTAFNQQLVGMTSQSACGVF